MSEESYIESNFKNQHYVSFNCYNHRLLTLINANRIITDGF